MAKTTTLYYKLLPDLSLEELLVYYVYLGEKKPPVRLYKHELIRLIYNKDPNFLDHPTKKFYFKKEETPPSKVDLIFVPSHKVDLDDSAYKQKQLRAQFKIDHETLKKEFLATQNQDEKSDDSFDISQMQSNGTQIVNTKFVTETLKEEPVAGQTSENQNTENAQTGAANSLQVTLEQLQTMLKSEHKSFPLQQKLKYEPSHGIEAFVKSVESYANSYNVSDKRRWIDMAKTALLASEDGLLLQEALTPAEETNWDLFKKKLLSILGNPPDYYRDYFRSFKRGTQKLGLAMSRLTQAYRRGFLDNGPLSDHDKRHILLQFIASLDNPLRGLVRAEEKSLKFETIAERASELERCFGQGFGPESTAAMMFPEGRIQMINNVKQQNQQEALQLKMMELLTSLTTKLDDQTKQIRKVTQQNANSDTRQRNNNGRNYRGKPGRRLTDEQRKGMDGYCIVESKNNNCHKTNCIYKHDNIPESVRKFAKSL